MAGIDTQAVNVQWFPGHMAKARRMITETAAMADGVCEIVDARIPVSSRNPEIGDLCGHKPRLIVLNRADQADEAQTAAWARRLEAEGNAVLLTDAKSGKGTNGFQAAVRRLLKEKIDYSVRCQVVRLMMKNLKILFIQLMQKQENYLRIRY